MKTYLTKVQAVEAIQATEDNLEEIAQICNGKITTGIVSDRRYVTFHSYKTNDTEAIFVEDWLVETGDGMYIVEDKLDFDRKYARQ